MPEYIKVFLSYIFKGKPPYIMINQALFSHLKRRGIHVWFLGVNNSKELDIAVKSGATAVLTDRPIWLNETINANKIKFSSISMT